MSFAFTPDRTRPLDPKQVSPAILDINKWVVFGEGGSTIVLSFVGNDHEFQGKVMYVYKGTHLQDPYNHTSQESDEFEEIFRKYLPIPSKVCLFPAVYCIFFFSTFYIFLRISKHILLPDSS